MFALLLSLLRFLFATPLGLLLVVAATVLFVVRLGLRVIHENESGLVTKKFGRPLAAGRLIATGGEAGFQARMLPPGWHFGVWRWRYKVTRVPLVIVRPGEIALVVAADGAPIPSQRILGREVACSHF